MTKRKNIEISHSLPMCVAAASIVSLSPAYAQAVPDIEDTITQGSQIEEIIRDQSELGDQLRADDGEIDGEAGIYVLQKNDIFFVGGSSGIGYSSNPLRTVDDVGDSFLANFAVTAGVQTKLAEAVDVGLRINVSGQEYFKSFGPSSRNANAALNVGVPLNGTPLYANLSVFGGLNFDSSFRNGTGFFGAAATINTAVPIGPKTLLRGNIGASRQWNETSDNNNKSVSTSASITHAVTQKLSVSASTRLSRTWYDDFFEDVTFTERRDWSYGGGVTANYRLNKKISFSVAAGYERRDSTFFLSNYDSFDASLLFSANVRF